MPGLFRLGVWFRDVVWRIEPEAFRLSGPDLKDMFVGREATQGLEPPGVIVGVHEPLEVGSQLFVHVVVIALDRGVFDRAVHPPDLPVGPRVVELGQAMLGMRCSAPTFRRPG